MIHQAALWMKYETPLGDLRSPAMSKWGSSDEQLHSLPEIQNLISDAEPCTPETCRLSFLLMEKNSEVFDTVP